jgi:hypothetical protein
MTDAIRAAQEAKATLADPAMTRAFQNVRDALVRSIEKSKSGSNVDELILCLRLLGSVKSNLETAVNHGKLDEFKLEQQKQRSANPLRNVFGR